MLNTAPQHVDHASFCNLTLEPGQKSSPLGTVMLKIDGLDQRSLGLENKVAKLRKVYRMLAIVVFGIAENPTAPAETRLRIGRLSGFKRFNSGRAGHRGDD